MNKSVHSCSYCGITDHKFLLGCLNCQKYFCNYKIGSRQQSDIVLHLNNSGHTKVSCRLNHNPLHCGKCGNTCIYELYQYRKENKVDIYCEKCAKKKNILLSPEIRSYIREKRFPIPVDKSIHIKDSKKIIILTDHQISFLEKNWKDGKNWSLEIIDQYVKPLSEILLNGIKQSYEHPLEYVNHFWSLIEEEEDYNKKTRGTWFQNKVEMKVKINGGKCYASLQSPKDCFFNIRLTSGDQLRIIKGKNGCQIEGMVRFAKEKKIELLLDTEKNEDLVNSNIFKDHPSVRIEYVWVDIPFQRLRKGLDAFYEPDSISENLFKWILNPPERNYTNNIEKNESLNIEFPNGFPKLNEYQMKAIETALNQDPITLIQGPPGTGKTATSTALIYKLLSKVPNKKEKILVCAPSNIAVDHLADRLILLNIDVCRMYSRRKEKLDDFYPSLKDVSLHHMILDSLGDLSTKLKDYIAKKDQRRLTEKEEKAFLKLKLKAEQEILENSKIICCTCIVAADLRLGDLFKKGYYFKYVIIDEAAQALEPESLLPLLYGAKKVILAGDHKQLNPLILSPRAKNYGFGQSLFERLAHKIEPIILLTQYRMHPEIAKFPSENFYQGKLENSSFLQKLKPLATFPWPNPHQPKFFYNVQGKEESPFGESYMNRVEGDAIRKLILLLMKSEVNPDRIAVLTPYNGQLMHLQELQDAEEIPQEVEIASIDGFQGREKDYILISCVRSNVELGLGFLNNKRRLNVALTRAKHGLIICGYALFLCKWSSLWKDLIKHYMESNTLVSGEIGENGELKGNKWSQVTLKLDQKWKD